MKRPPIRCPIVLLGSTTTHSHIETNSNNVFCRNSIVSLLRLHCRSHPILFETMMVALHGMGCDVVSLSLSSHFLLFSSPFSVHSPFLCSFPFFFVLWLSWFRLVFVWFSRDFCVVFVLFLFGFCLVFVWFLRVVYLVFVWVFVCYFFGFIWLCLGFVWSYFGFLFGFCLVVSCFVSRFVLFSFYLSCLLHPSLLSVLVLFCF